MEMLFGDIYNADENFIEEFYGIRDVDLFFDKEDGSFSISGKAEKDKTFYQVLSLYERLMEKLIKEDEDEEEKSVSLQERFIDSFLKNNPRLQGKLSIDNTVWDRNSLEKIIPELLVKEAPSSKEMFLVYYFIKINLSKNINKNPTFFDSIAVDSNYKEISAINVQNVPEFNYIVFLREDGKEYYDVLFFNLS